MGRYSIALGRAPKNIFSLDSNRESQGFYRAHTDEIDRGAFIFINPEEYFIECKQHIGTIFCKYKTDQYGEIIPPFSYKLFLWVFGKQTYQKIRACNTEFPITQHDVKIVCWDEQYQTVNIVPCVESIWLAKKELTLDIQGQFIPMWEHLEKIIDHKK
jgi:hypothetical protein